VVFFEVRMTPAEVRAVAKEAATEAVKACAPTIAQKAVTETLMALGIDAENPLDTQADFNWLHNTRRQSEKFRFALFLAVAVSLMGFLGAALWGGIIDAIRGQ
jgi:hypothetical protein